MKNVIPDVSRLVARHITAAPAFQYWPDCRETLLQMLAAGSHPAHALPYLACLAAGGQPEAAIPVTAAWATLVHAAYLLDDLQDGDLERTSHILPPENAMNIGLAWIFAAFRMLDDPGLGAEARGRIASIFSQAGLDSARGQHQELAWNQVSSSTEEQLGNYWQAMIHKSGSIYAAGAAAGAAAGQAPDAWIEALADYGTTLGVVYQVIDDCRDLQDDAQQLQKTTTLPAILYRIAMNAPPSPGTLAGGRPLELAGSGQTQHTNAQEIGIPEAIAGVLLEWRRRGMESLQRLTPSPARDELAGLLDHTLKLTA